MPPCRLAARRRRATGRRARAARAGVAASARPPRPLPFRQEILSYRLRPFNLESVGTDFEALVVGGAAAGLSAALVLGRARVRTLVVDAGEPSNRSAPAIGGLLGQDGTSPARLYAAGREQLTELPAVELREGVVVGIEPAGAFRATLAGGATGLHRTLVFGNGS